MRVLAYLLILVVILPTVHAECDWDTQKIIREFKPTKVELDIGAVVLRNDSSLRVSGVDQQTTDYCILVAVLSDQAARDYGNISISYNSYFSDIDLVSAKTIQADGVSSDVSPDAIMEKTDNDPRMYSDIRYLTFSLPRLTDKSFLEYHVRVKTKKPTIPGFWTQLMFFQEGQNGEKGYRVDPVRYSHISVIVPKGQKFEYHVENSNAKLKKTSLGDQDKYLWIMKDIPEIKFEPNMPSLADKWSMIRFSSIPNWADIDNWAHSEYKSRMQVNAEISSIAHSVTKNLHRDEDKIRALYYHMLENVRYISADVRRNGFIPHFATETWDNKYGDCKDQAVLFAAMLNSIGIEAYPSLVGVYPRIDVTPDIPSIGFSHMIVYVPLKGKDIWIDTSGDWGSFPGVSWDINTRYSFVIDGAGGKLLKIDDKSSESSDINYFANYSFEKDKLNVLVNLDLTGDYAFRYKNFYKYTRHPELEIEKIFKELFPKSERLAVIVEDNAAQDGPFHVTAKIVLDYKETANNEPIIFRESALSIMSRFASISDLPKKENRVNDVFLGSIYTFNYRATYEAPGKNYHGSIHNQDFELSNDYFDYRFNVDEAASGYTVDAIFKLKQEIISADDYSEFDMQLKRAQDDGIWVIVFNEEKLRANEARLKNEIVTNSENTESLIELARHHISTGNYDNAQKLVEKIINKEEKNGEAHYLMGIIWGYKNNYNKSEDYLEKADDYGYIP